MNDDLSGEVARGALWSAVERWGARLVSTAVLVILTRTVAPEAFGVIAIVSVLLAAVGIILEQGFTQAIIQRSDIEDEHLDSAFWFNLAFSAVLSVGVFLAAEPLAHWLNEPQVARATRLLSVVPIVGALSTVPSALLQRDMNFKAMSKRGLIANVVSGIVGVSLALGGYSVDALSGQIIAFAATSSLILFTASDWRPRLRFSAQHIRDIVSFGSTLFLTDLVGFVNRRSDDTIVGVRLGTADLGMYSLGYRLFMTLTDLILVPINDVALPAFSRLQHDRAALGAAFLRIIRMSSAIGFPAFVGLSLLAPEITEVLFGSVWADAAPVMRIVSLVGVIHAVTFFHHTALVAMGEPKISLWITVSYAVVNVTGFLIAVRYGIVAVAAAYALRALVIAPIEAHVTAGKLEISMGGYAKSLAPAFFATGFMAALVGLASWLISPAWLTLLIGVPLGVGAYTLALRTIAPSVIDEARSYLSAARQN